MQNPVQSYLDAHPGETYYSLARSCGINPMTLYKLLVKKKTRFLQPETMMKLHVGTLGGIKVEDLEAWNRSAVEG